MAEFWFYIIGAFVLVGWIGYKIRKTDLYIDWIEEDK